MCMLALTVCSVSGCQSAKTGPIEVRFHSDMERNCYPTVPPAADLVWQPNRTRTAYVDTVATPGASTSAGALASNHAMNSSAEPMEVISEPTNTVEPKRMPCPPRMPSSSSSLPMPPASPAEAEPDGEPDGEVDECRVDQYGRPRPWHGHTNTIKK